MKRSDMLRLIWESINEVEDAETLLTRIESVGMLPPYSHNDDVPEHKWDDETLPEVTTRPTEVGEEE